MLQTRNIEGGFTEKLICKYYKGSMAQASTKGYDFTANGKRYQVKSRILSKRHGNFSDIKPDFDILVAVLYDEDGNIKLVKEYTYAAATQLANSCNNGRQILSVSTVNNSTKGKNITQNVKYRFNNIL